MAEGKEYIVARRRRLSASGLLVATSSSIHNRIVVDRCIIPVDDGEGGTRPCGHPLYEHEPRAALEAHIRDCAARNHNTIMELRQRQHPEVMEAWDPELAAWAQKNADAIMRGAKRM